jgi:hypothetical protein
VRQGRRAQRSEALRAERSPLPLPRLLIPPHHRLVMCEEQRTKSRWLSAIRCHDRLWRVEADSGRKR